MLKEYYKRNWGVHDSKRSLRYNYKDEISVLLESFNLWCDSKKIKRVDSLNDVVRLSYDTSLDDFDRAYCFVFRRLIMHSFNYYEKKIKI